MGDSRGDLPDNIYDKYAELRDQQYVRMVDLTSISSKLDNLPINQSARSEAAELLRSLIDIWKKAVAEDAVLRDMNSEGILSGQSYFRELRFAGMQIIYERVRMMLQKILPQDPLFNELSFHVSELDTSSPDVDNSPVGESERVRMLEKELALLRAKMQVPGEDPTMFLKYFQQMEGDVTFPEFPSDRSGYRVWRKRVDIWNRKSSCLDESDKAERLLRSVKKNTVAKSIVDCFDSSIEDNYVEMLKALDEQFMTGRLTIFNHLNELIMGVNSGRKGVEALQEIFNKFAYNWKNFETSCAELMDEALAGNELEKVKFQLNAIKTGLIFRALDEATSNKVTMHLKLGPNTIPKADTVLEYVKIIFVNARCAGFTRCRELPKPAFIKKIEVSKRQFTCSICDKDHKVLNCHLFKGMPIKQRRETVRRKGLCFICLYRPYKECQCGMKDTCRLCSECGQKHHILLHDRAGKPAAISKVSMGEAIMTKNDRAGIPRGIGMKSKPTPAEQQSGYENFSWAEQALSANEFVYGTNKVYSLNMLELQPTAIVSCSNLEGTKKIDARILVDTGANEVLITYDLAKRLGLVLSPVFKPATDFQGTAVEPVRHETSLTIHSKHESFSVSTQAYLRKALGGVRPVPREFVIKTKVPLADVSDKSTGGRIDMFVPSSFLARIKKPGYIRLSESLVLENTRLGFMPMGTLKSNDDMSFSDRQSISSTNMVRIENSAVEWLGRFFDADAAQATSDEVLAEQKFQEFFRREKNGKMVVGLPLVDSTELGESKKVCLYRVHRVMNQLPQNFKLDYVKHFEDLEKKGYIRVADPQVPAKYYIPHLPVINEASLTHPLRIVFDSSQKSSNGKSLNDIQLKTPVLQNSLQLVLVSARVFESMVSCDLSKMYLSIGLIEQHVQYQRTFMPTRNGKLVEMEMPTVIFGNKSSSFLAIRSLHQLAELEGDKHPLARSLLKDALYVDDGLFSLPKGMRVQEATRQLMEIAECAQLKFRKWTSNDPEAIHFVPQEDKLEDIEKQLGDSDVGSKAGVLGLSWLIKSDHLVIKRNKLKQLQEGEPLTLRFAMSMACTVFDCLGVLAPIFLLARTLLKEIYNETLAGSPIRKKDKRLDMAVSEGLRKKWCDWTNLLMSIEDFKIKRWIGHKPENKLSILAFGDASIEGTGVAIYAHSEGMQEVEVNLLLGKSNIRPSGVSWTIAKLELRAAEKAVKMGMEVKDAVEKALQRAGINELVDIYFFSDSEITLAWLQGNPDDRTAYVKNRLKAIKELCPEAKFFYIDTKNNPADLSSRTAAAADFLHSELWWHGPEIFRKKDSLKNLQVREYKTILEMRSVYPQEGDVKTAFVSLNEVSLQAVVQHMDNISGWSASITRLAWIRRAIFGFKRVNLKLKELSTLEKDQARVVLFKAYQHQGYSKEIQCLRKKEHVISGPLQGKCPFIDNDGLLRISSRMQNVKPIKFSEANPIVLPTVDKQEIDEAGLGPLGGEIKCGLAVKLIRHFHEQLMHAGTDKVVASLNREFYLPNIRRTVKNVLFRCVKCRAYNKRNLQQVMGSVPMENVTPSPPFYHVSLDAFGPLRLKRQPGKRLRSSSEEEAPGYAKVWGVVFCCRATRAVHIEAIADLSAEEFLMSFRNFVATRGLPRSVYTDSQTNFKKGGLACVALTSKELTARIRAACKSKNPLGKSAKAINSYLKRDSEIDSIESCIQYVEAKYTDQQVIFLRGKGDVLKFAHAPCYSPHFNGRAEAEVKVIKNCLKKTTQTASLNIREFHSILKRIEAIVNSRPIAIHTPDDHSRPFVLTPAHFLVGRPLVALPQSQMETLDGKEIKLTKRVAMMDDLVDKCWSMLRDRHFQQLRSRPKWLKIRENLKPGDMVLLRERNSGVNCWPKALVTKIHPGRDGVVRVVTVKNALGHEHERAITEVIQLPLSVDLAIQSTVLSKGQNDVQSRHKLQVSEQSTIKSRGSVASEREVHAKTAHKAQSTEPIKNRIRKSPRFNMLTLMLMFLFFHDVLGSFTMQQSPAGGALVIAKGAAFRKRGELRWLVATGMKPAQDEGVIRDSITDYKNQCYLCGGYTFKMCTANLRVLWALQDKAHRILSQLEKVNTAKSRKRRDAENDGVLVHLWQWLFGSHQHQPASEVVTHMARSQELMVDHQRQLEKQVNEQLNKLQDAVEADSSAGEALMEKVVQFQHTFVLIEEKISWILDKYRKVHLPDDELEAMIKALKNKQTRILSLSEGQWRELIRPRMVSDGQQVFYEVLWPIIEDQRWELLTIAANPNEKGQIYAFSPTSVVVNVFEKLYATGYTKIARLQDKTWIVEADVVEKLTEKSPCCLNIAMAKKHDNCLVKNLEERCDSWVEIETNLYHYVSNVEKELVCVPSSRIPITGFGGVIAIKKGCYINTEMHKIEFKNDWSQSINASIYHFPEWKAAWNNTGAVSQRSNVSGIHINLSDVEEEILAARGDNNQALWIVGLGTTVGVLTILGLIFAGAWYYKITTIPSTSASIPPTRRRDSPIYADVSQSAGRRAGEVSEP